MQGRNPGRSPELGLGGASGAVAGTVGGVAAVVASKGGESEDAVISYSGPVSGQYTVTQTIVGINRDTRTI